jgi:hypothetical protein
MIFSFIVGNTCHKMIDIDIIFNSNVNELIANRCNHSYLLCIYHLKNKFTHSHKNIFLYLFSSIEINYRRLHDHLYPLLH